MTGILQIYADGSFDAASQSGGWAFVVMDSDGSIQISVGTAFGCSNSNNTLEVLSVVKAASWLEAGAPPSAAVVWTDSAHVVDGCNRWRLIWRGNGWKRVRANPHERRRPIPDVKLWRELDALMDRNPHLRVELCKGHSGNQGNEHADKAARQACAALIRQQVVSRNASEPS